MGQEYLELTLAGKKWSLTRAGNLEDLWEEMTGQDPEQEDHIPYWTELWPASRLLALHLHDRREQLFGKLCLDIGCGLGLTALQAGSLGARVMAMDLEWPALYYARKNAALNSISGLCWVRMDWRKPALQPEKFDYVWAADVLYETRFSEPLINLLRHCVKNDARIWIADPERNVSAGIWERFSKAGFGIREIKRERIREKGHGPLIRLLELTPLV